MTTSTVQITAELLDELEQKANAATPGPWGRDGALVCPSRVEDGTTYVESWRPVAWARGAENTRFIAAANPSTILALTAHIRSLAERLGNAEKDAGRYRWLGDGKRGDYCWNNVLSANQRAKHHDLEEAIDAAIAQEADHE